MFDEVGPGRHALLRVDGSIVSRVMIVPRTVQIGDGALLQAFESQMHENDIAALSPSDADFHARFDRESWRGPLAERTSAGIQQSPDDECVMIQRLPRTPSSIDLDALLSDRVALR